MQLRRANLPDPTAFLPSANAVAKLSAAGMVMAVAFLSSDPVTPAILLAGEAVALLLTGLRPAEIARLIGPLLAAAAILGAVNGLLAGPTPSVAEPDRWMVGLGLGLRIAAIALGGILALATTDPADLAAGLVGQLRVPPRLAVGALAALRLMPVLAAEWRTIALARRARGVDAGRNPAAAAGLAARALVTLLVSAIRRSTRLALAMDARGFDSRVPRTLARPPRMRGADWLLLAVAATLGAGAVAVSMALGSWTFLLG